MKKKELRYMGRLKGGHNVSNSKEEKLALVLRNLSGESLMNLQRGTGYTILK